MASYVDITRDEFEGWLNSTKFRGKWSQKKGTAGIFVLPLSETVAIELSSSLSGKGETMGHGEASMSMKLVSLITGQTLNKVAQGQNHWKRTINWAKNLEVGLDRMEDAYRKSSAFYDAIAAIKDRTEYKQTNMAKIEAVTGWEKNPFLHDLHERLDRDGILTGKQLEALDRATSRTTQAGRALSPRQGEILDRLLGENQAAIVQVLRRSPQLSRAASEWFYSPPEHGSGLSAQRVASRHTTQANWEEWKEAGSKGYPPTGVY